MRVLRRIRQAVRERQYRISSHANEEMSNDELVLEDIERILLTGESAAPLPTIRGEIDMKSWEMRSTVGVDVSFAGFCHPTFCC